MSTIQGRAAARLYSGSALVARRIGVWLIPEQRPIVATIRTVGSGWVGLHLLDLAHQSPVWVVGSASAWCVAAWRAGDPARPATTAAQAPAEELAAPPVAEPEEPLEGLAQTPDVGEFLHLLHRLLPTPGSRIHLTQIAAELTGDEKQTATVRELAAAAGVPITAVRVPGRGSSTGLKAEELPPFPPSSGGAPVGVVVAGQAGQQHHQQHHEEESREGFTIMPDPDGDLHRWTVQHHDRPAQRAS
ncbi:hypothetical protein [Kitasatospora sp. NPDC050543]|uniref:hypothetical protein n=1 Tax=Kitasatospora sp. NPDC050543 TaxID=3364054 RepID=UPI0037B5B189